MRVLARFDRAGGQVAESIAPEPDGSVVVGMIPARQVVRVRVSGQLEVLVTMPSPPGGGGTTPALGDPVVTGVARTDDGRLFFLYSAGEGGMTGVWRLREGLDPELVVPLPADAFPNALVVDASRDRFLITDSTGGRIWSAPLDGGEASVWSDDPLLAPNGFFGANGLTVRADIVWSSNSDAGTVVRVPVDVDGRAGVGVVHAEGMPGIDDFDLTGDGDEVLAAINQGSRLMRIDDTGEHVTLLDADDGLQGTTAVVVHGDRVLVTNGANLQGTESTLMTARLVRDEDVPSSLRTGRPPASA